MTIREQPKLSPQLMLVPIHFIFGVLKAEPMEMDILHKVVMVDMLLVVMN